MNPALVSDEEVAWYMAHAIFLASEDADGVQGFCCVNHQTGYVWALCICLGTRYFVAVLAVPLDFWRLIPSSRALALRSRSAPRSVVHSWIATQGLAMTIFPAVQVVGQGVWDGVSCDLGE